MSERLLNRNFVFMLLTAFFIYLSMSMTGSLLAKYLDYLHTSDVIIGFITGVFAVAALLIRIVSGRAVDVFDRNRILALVMACVAISCFGYGLSKSPLVITGFRILHGLAWGFGSTTCLTVAADSLSAQKMTQGIAVYGIFQQIAQMIAPALALYFLGYFSYQNAFCITSIFALLALFMTLLVKAKKPAGCKQPFFSQLTFDNIIEKKAVLPAVLILLISLQAGGISAFMILYADWLKITGISAYFIVNGVTMILLRPFLAKILDWLKLKRTIILGQLLLFLSLIGIAVARDLNLLLVMAVVSAVGFCLVQPTLMTLCINAAGEERRGVASSTNYIGTDIGTFLGSFFSGLLVTLGGFRFMFALLCIPALIAIALFCAYYKPTAAASGL
ncbi:MAG: MFS transporter [Erysipelotrichaceae bacterium]|jgi:MFS family permease|nr:MFS transporter [Erysipelotrichaceae bacterium]